MATYSRSRETSSQRTSLDYFLGGVAATIQRDPSQLFECARQVGKLVHQGELERHTGWYACWEPAVLGGLAQLEAQQIIGEAFLAARESSGLFRIEC